MYEQHITDQRELERLLTRRELIDPTAHKLRFDESKAGRICGQLSAHERILRQSLEDSGLVATGRHQASVEFWYEHASEEDTNRTSATIHLYAITTSSDLGTDAYTIQFSTLSFGNGLRLEVLYLDGFPAEVEVIRRSDDMFAFPVKASSRF